MKKIALFLVAAALSTAVISCSKSKTCTCTMNLGNGDTTFSQKFDDADQAKTYCDQADAAAKLIDPDGKGCEL